jgi:hypothetical protein
MSVSATRSTTITFSGDVTGTETISAATNAVSPGSVTVQTLSSGANTITVPATTGVTVTAVTIVPPTGNTQAITLKGVSGDTGIVLHNTDPSTISLGSTVTTFVLNAAAQITGVRFFWS